MNKPKLRLKLDLEELATAMKSHDDILETISYLDVETGKIVMINGEDRQLLEKVYENHLDPGSEKVDWPQVIPLLNLYEWQIEQIILAEQVEANRDDRYIEIPEMEPYSDYNDMVDFIDNLSDRPLQERLEDAIHGKGAFRRFRDILASHSEVQEEWYRYSGQRMRERVMNWLKSEDIEVIEGEAS